MSETKFNKKLRKEIVNIIRTAMRNNIELTNIADNKANVLLSINTLIITILVPLILINVDLITRFRLIFPLIVLIVTSLVTIYLLVLVLIPRGFGEKVDRDRSDRQVSPFFFGNFYQMSKEEFQEYFSESILNSEDLHGHIVEDLYYLGTVLAKKMTTIRLAFYIYMAGLFLAVSITAFLLIFYT